MEDHFLKGTRGQDGDCDVPSRRPQLGQRTKEANPDQSKCYTLSERVSFGSFDKDLKARWIEKKTRQPKHNIVKGSEIKGRINYAKNVTRNW